MNLYIYQVTPENKGIHYILTYTLIPRIIPNASNITKIANFDKQYDFSSSV
jgi:hypothetical protein